MAWLFQPLLQSAAALAGAAPTAFLSAWAINSNSVLGGRMKKNVSGQKIGAQLVSATDGSAFTGSVTVSVTGDAGAQATGSVGAGACTHEGSGYHTYDPAQAETNYDLIAFTFTGTGAVPATVQIFSDFPQTGDNFGRVGAPVGASISADIAAIKAETVTILADTNDIQTRLPAALVSGRIDASVGAMAANVMTAAAAAADLTTELQTGLSTAANLAIVAAYIDTEVAAILAAVDTEIAAIKAKTDSLTFTLAGKVDANTLALSGDTVAADNAEAFFDGTGYAGTGNVIPTVTTVGTVTTLTNLPAITAGWLTATGIAADAITAAKVAADVTTELQVGLATAANLAIVAAYIDTEVAAIKAKTDSLTFTVAGQVDANAESMNAAAILGNGTALDLWRGV